MVTPKGSMSTEGETLQICPKLQVLAMSTLGDAADVNPVIKFLPHTLQHLARQDVAMCVKKALEKKKYSQRSGEKVT